MRKRLEAARLAGIGFSTARLIGKGVLACDAFERAIQGSDPALSEADGREQEDGNNVC